MDYGNLTLMRLLHQKMDYNNKRQDQLASNIANKDVPGYQARDIKEPDFASMANAASKRIALRVTDPKHLTGPTGGGSAQADKMRTTYETVPVKNNVSYEEQEKNMAMNKMEYQEVLNLYGKYDSLFKTAIGQH